MAKSVRPANSGEDTSKEQETPKEQQTPQQEVPATPTIGVKVVNGSFIDLHYKNEYNLDTNIRLLATDPVLKVPATQENLTTLEAYASRGIINLIK